MASALHQRFLKRWRKVEACLPLRGKWLAWALIAALAALWLVGLQVGWSRWHYRIYWASSPGRPYSWNRKPEPGLDCSSRMAFTFSGEIARSLRIGDLVFEVGEDYGIASGRSHLEGPDCH